MKIALAGLGAIGAAVARRVLSDGIPGIQLVAVSARDHGKARATLDGMNGSAVPVVELEGLAALADLVIECAPSALMDRIAQPALRAGKKLLVLSAGALLPRPELLELA